MGVAEVSLSANETGLSTQQRWEVNAMKADISERVAICRVREAFAANNIWLSVRDAVEGGHVNERLQSGGQIKASYSVDDLDVYPGFAENALVSAFQRVVDQTNAVRKDNSLAFTAVRSDKGVVSVTLQQPNLG